MTADPETKLAALDQLRSWRAMFDRRDSLIYAAHLAGASYSEIRDASGAAVNTVRTAIAAQQEAALPTTTTDPLATFHHPHFLSVRHTERNVEFTFKPFTGNETKPSVPDGPYQRPPYVDGDGSQVTVNLSAEERHQLYREYDAAQVLWATARFRRSLKARVPEAAGVRLAYQAARKAMNDAYEALLTTGDASWRSQIMRLTELQDVARAGASAWDEAEEELLTLEQTFLKESECEYESRHRPQLVDVIHEYSGHADKWDLNSLFDHKGDRYTSTPPVPPATKDTEKVIEQQNARIRKVTELAGTPNG